MGQFHVVVTGANRGIGLEFVRQYLKQGAKVTACVRSKEGLGDLINLKEQSDTLSISTVDVTDQYSIRQFAASLSQPVSLFINNAGVYGQRSQGLEQAAVEDWVTTLSVNTIAPLMLTRYLLPRLEADQPKLIYITSKMGSMADNSSGGCYVYRSSKAALNAVVKSLSEDLKADGITVLALHPGWVKTRMGGDNALISAEASVTGMRAIIDQATIEESGRFLDYQGKLIPW